MCNLSVSGSLNFHRKSRPHQRLKMFLHPKCSGCAQDFTAREDWDEHLLSAEHLAKKARLLEKKGPEAAEAFDAVRSAPSVYLIHIML